MKGRGRGRGRGNGKAENYIELGKKQLFELFPKLSKDVVLQTFQKNHHDMAKTIADLRELSGEPVLEDEHASIKNQTGKHSFCLEEKIGDLFSCSENTSLVHCVSVDLAMGKGIAVEFKNRFGHVNDLKAQNKKIGEVAILKHKEKFVYYLITKQFYWHKPTYTDLKNTLVELREHCLANTVTHLAMPKIGCGLDGLIWVQVKNILKEVFWDTDIHISVYRLS
eukprot:TRINITY_DN8732_c0_g1_i1.p1 TRINITY_DN8732_c0_g1~~TRINITY_DN8732_c0_g1_i1.p1  ORF type:complete len:223 (-),score=30.11 TRINITY_DN8732_c0_g1_i1:73-741(-)